MDNLFILLEYYIFKSEIMIDRIIVFGGKGGVGKSSISAATAVKLAKDLPDKRILLISFDIAHNVTDLFGSKIN